MKDTENIAAELDKLCWRAFTTERLIEVVMELSRVARLSVETTQGKHASELRLWRELEKDEEFDEARDEIIPIVGGQIRVRQVIKTPATPQPAHASEQGAEQIYRRATVDDLTATPSEVLYIEVVPLSQSYNLRGGASRSESHQGGSQPKNKVADAPPAHAIETTSPAFERKLLDEIADKLGCPRDAEAILAALSSQGADTKRLDWLDETQGLCDDGDGNPFYQEWRVTASENYRGIREAIDAAMKRNE